MTPDDPALTLPWSQIQAMTPQTDGVVQEPRGGATPHGVLKKACRRALHDWLASVGGMCVTIPIANMVAQIPGTHRKYGTGRSGAGDDMMLVRGPDAPGGAMRTLPLSTEYKAGKDRQSPKQAVFQRKWELAGGTYIIARDPDQFVAGVRSALASR